MEEKKNNEPAGSDASEPGSPRKVGEVKLFDLVEETRRKLQPYLKIETFPTGSKPLNYLAVDTILQAALEAYGRPPQASSEVRELLAEGVRLLWGFRAKDYPATCEWRDRVKAALAPLRQGATK